ncbi:MAG: hypothetical protein ABSH34_22760 [Verrucomicrobiota bacterium]|jgi:hypothetical protein
MSKRLRVYVEGATEEFFNRIFRNHLAQSGVIVERPILAATSTLATGQRGGFTSWPAVEADLRILLRRNPQPGGHQRRPHDAPLSNAIPA